MSNKTKYAAVLLGLLMAGGIAFADSTNLISSADATAVWGSVDYQVADGSGLTMNIRHDGSEVYQHSWGLVKFDFSVLPANSVVTNAIINVPVILHNWPASANFAPMSLFNNLGDWTEAGGTTAPGKDAVAAQTLDSYTDWWGNPAPFTGANTLTNGSGGWLTYSGADVTAMVSNWVSGANYGCSIEPTGVDYTDTERYFLLQTREQSWAQPNITVEYMPGPPPTSANLPVTADATAVWGTVDYRVSLETGASMNLRHDGTEVYQHSWGLATFDFSSIPENVVITNASIRFVVDVHSDFIGSQNFVPLALFNNLGDWAEADMTAPLRERVPVETRDYFLDWDQITPIPFTGTNTVTSASAGWFFFSGPNVLDLVQGWYDGSITNFGLSIEPAGTNYTDTTRHFLLNTKETGWGAPYIFVEWMDVPVDAEQTMALGASDDSTVAFYDPANGTTFGADPVMEVRNDVVIVASLATFDLSSLSGVPIEVTGAKIRFYADLPDSVWSTTPENFSSVAMYKNTSAWDESTVTGLTAPTFDPTAVETIGQFVAAAGTNTVPFTGANTIDKTAGGWLEFSGSNTLALVQGWVNGTIPNNGVGISATVANDTDRLFWLQTKEALAAGAHPQLILEFLGGLTYADWAATWGVDLSDKEADYEGDGLDNLLEYAFGGNPTNDDAAAVSPSIEIGADVTHVYNSRIVSELTYQLYVDLDSNLITPDWTNAAALGGVVTIGTTVDPEFNTVTNTFAGGGVLDQAFLKLEVSD